MGPSSLGLGAGACLKPLSSQSISLLDTKPVLNGKAFSSSVATGKRNLEAHSDRARDKVHILSHPQPRPKPTLQWRIRSSTGVYFRALERVRIRLSTAKIAGSLVTSSSLSATMPAVTCWRSGGEDWHIMGRWY